MRRSTWFTSLIVFGGLSFTLVIALVGCNTSKPNDNKGDTVLEDSAPTGRELCKQLVRSKEAVQIREVLHQFAPLTDKTQTDEMQRVSQQQQDLLEKDFLLNGEELEEVKSLMFRPMDAHYIESCFLMRDIVQQLDQATRDPEDGTALEPFELAQFLFGWVNRQVLPGIAQGDDWPGPTTQDAWVPSHIVLRRGHGSPRDRALIFLELARQLQLQGFLFDSIKRDFKNNEAQSWPLVGLIHEGNVYLFDPVLGMPVPADGKSKGVATLAGVLQKPELFEPLGISAKDLVKSEIVLDCPLSGLAPRMKMLEGFMQSHLSDSERSVLFVDARKLLQDVARIVKEQTKEPKLVIGIGGGPERFSPTRMLFAFLPPEDGGRKAMGDNVDEKTKDANLRKAMMALSQLPFGDKQIGHNLGRLQVPDRDMLQFLGLKSRLVLELYTAQPRQMLLRGQFQSMKQRFRRIVDILNDAPNTADAEFKEDLNLWFKAYREIKNEIKKQNLNPNYFWTLDPVFFAVLDVNADTDPRAVERENDARKQFAGVRPRMLTYVVMAGCCRGLLDPQVRFFQAERALEKAEALQVRLKSVLAQGARLKAAKADEQKIKDNARKAADLADQLGYSWKDAHSFLASSVSPPLTRAALEKSVHELGEARLGGDAEFASLETLQRSWATYGFARMQLIRTKQQIGSSKAALEEFRLFDDDLKALIKSENLQTGLKNVKDQSRLHSSFFIDNQALLIKEFSEPSLQIMRQKLAQLKQN